MNTRFLLISVAMAAFGAAGVAVAADPPIPPAPPAPPRMEHHFEPSRIDANHDGFISRAEAQAEAERMFAHLDANNDGKLDAADHAPRMMMRQEMHSGGGRHVEEDVTIERETTDAPQDGVRREVRKEVIVKDGQGRHRRHGPRGHGGMMGGPPMGLMIFAHAGEADTNNDGALSKAEFVNQQLRFFDAADVNGDGKIKFEPPPMPPAPPEPPEPPAPPIPPAH